MFLSSRIVEFVDNFPDNGLHTVKLRDILSLRNTENVTRDIVTTFPPIDIGSITLVDQIVLLCLDELIGPNTILEIGTFKGYTTRIFLKNSNAKKVYSVDLPRNKNSIPKNARGIDVLINGDKNDDYLRDVQNISGEIYLEDVLLRDEARLVLIKNDSTTLDFYNTFPEIQLAFIDGGHSYDIIKSDTEKVLQILRQGVIIWHDFSSGLHSDVTRFITERSRNHTIFHVHGSLCAFQFISGA